jgi:hypothetical protein
MHTLVKSMPLRQLLLEQLPVFACALVIAETFYKFHSFTLECLAFLATWYVIDLTVKFLGDIYAKFR